MNLILTILKLVQNVGNKGYSQNNKIDLGHENI